MTKRILAIYFTFLFNTSFTQNVDSLRKLISPVRHDTDNIFFYTTIGDAYYFTNSDSSDFYWNYAEKLAKKDLLTEQNKLVRTKLLNELATVINNIGLVKNSRGNVAGALDNYFEALEIYEKINDKIGTLSVLNNIGIIYYGQGDLNKAEEFCLKAIKIAEPINDKLGLANSYNYLGYVYSDMRQQEKAYNSFLKALNFTAPDNYYVLSYLYNDLGVIHHQRRELDKALEYYNRSLEFRIKIGNKQGEANSYNNIGKIYTDKKEYAKAEGFLKRSMAMAKDLKFPASIKQAAEQLTVIYKNMSKPAEALKMYELYIQMRDSLTNQETRKATVKSQLKYEYEKKEIEIRSAAKAEKEKIELKAAEDKKRQDVITYSVMFGFIVVLVFSFFIYRSLQENKKKNIIIARQKQTVEEKQKELMDSINYAKRIQIALLPSEKYIDRSLNELNKK